MIGVDGKRVGIARDRAISVKVKRKQRRMKSEVRKASPFRRVRSRSRDRARGSSHVVERHRNKVLMIRKGSTEIGEDVEVMVEKTKDPQVFKVWCEGKDAKKIWEARKKWEEEETARVEEWKSIAERRARAKAIEGMKRMARKAGFKDARIAIQEHVWGRREEDEEE